MKKATSGGVSGLKPDWQISVVLYRKIKYISLNRETCCTLDRLARRSLESNLHHDTLRCIFKGMQCKLFPVLYDARLVEKLPRVEEW